jgi:uncharacterized protein GlcG (DUF336 family)
MTGYVSGDEFGASARLERADTRQRKRALAFNEVLSHLAKWLDMEVVVLLGGDDVRRDRQVVGLVGKLTADIPRQRGKTSAQPDTVLFRVGTNRDASLILNRAEFRSAHSGTDGSLCIFSGGCLIVIGLRRDT